jgi:hypothetical protein
MQFLFSILALALVGNSSFATVDGHDRVYIVVQDVQSEEFFLERAPIIGCYGTSQGARLGAFVKEYKAISNVGCGSEPVYENINTLSCATIVDAKESQDFYSYSEVTLDISKCSFKNDAQFITMVRTAAAKNFPQMNKQEVVLKLIK